MLEGISAKQFLRDLLSQIRKDNVFNGAAVLGYYLTLAVFPAMILLMSVIPYLPIDRVDEAIMNLLGQIMPSGAYTLVEGVVAEVTETRSGGLLSFGLLATLWAASTGMYAIMRQLNMTYDVAEARTFFRARAMALVLCLVFGVLVLGSFALIVLGSAIEGWIQHIVGPSQLLSVSVAVLRWVLIVLGLLLGFALIYRFAPNVDQPFAFISLGSVVGVMLLILASLGFLGYVKNFAHYQATYGSIGAVMMLMLWLYIAGLVILVGSEINAVLAQHRRTGTA